MRLFALAFPRTGMFFVAPGDGPTVHCDCARWFGSLRAASRAARRWGCVVVPVPDIPFGTGPVFGPHRF